MTDIATRVYNHTWKIDPIVRSVLDTDFYKLLMAQTIFRRHRDAQGHLRHHQPHRAASSSPGSIDIGELKEQLDHIRTLSPVARRVDLPARQHVLRQAADVRARLHRLARGLPLSRPTTWSAGATSTS